MARKKSRFRFIKRLISVLLLLAMFLGAGLLPPTFAHIAAETSVVQSLPDAQNLLQQGKELYEAERFSEAVAVWQQAVAAFQSSRDELQQAMTLGNLSLAYQQLGQWTEAEGAIAHSLNLLGWGDGGNPRTRLAPKSQIQNLEILAQALDIKGRLLLALAKAEEALNIWRQAIDIYAQLGDENAMIRNRIHQAQALQTLGLYRQAQKTLIESTERLQNQPNSLLKAIGLRSLGNILLATGALEQSRQILQQSVAVASSLPNPQAIADALLILGNTARAQQDTQAALQFYQQAANASTSLTTRIQAQVNQLSLLVETKRWSNAWALLPTTHSQIAELPASRTAIYARINLAQSLMKLGREKAGEQEVISSALLPAQLLSTAVQQAKSLQDQRTESYALGVLGGLYEQKKQLSDAQNLTQQALLIAQAIDAKDIAYQWQWQLGRLLRARGDIPGAITAYTEAVNHLQSLRRDLVAMNPEAQFSFRDRVEPVYRQLVELLLQPQGSSQPSSKNLQAARDTIESLQLAELDNFFREACLVGKRQIDQILKYGIQVHALLWSGAIVDTRVDVLADRIDTAAIRYVIGAWTHQEA